MKKLENLNESKSIKLEEENKSQEKISTNTNNTEIGSSVDTKNVPCEVTSNVVRDSEIVFINSQPKEPVEDQELKCKFAAIVMDRFFFFVSVFYAIITLVSLIMSIPILYR